MELEKKKLIHSLFYPLLFVLLIGAVKLAEVLMHTSFAEYGIYPLHWSGLPGIIVSPLLHEDWSHLLANSGPLLILGSVIFYFYRAISFRVIGLIYFMTGLWVWLMAREAYHIGASGVVYGMASFVFTSGILRKDSRLMAVSLLVVFLYGGLLWGLFPQLFPEKNISWESHLMGIIAGIVTAVYYRREGPPKRRYEWEDEEEEEVPEWFPEEVSEQPKEGEETQKSPAPGNSFTVNYIYKEKPGPSD